jgi:hypothetical protein
VYSQKLRSFGRVLVIGSAAVLIQLGAVAAADQRSDSQEQVREVLSGTVAAHIPQVTDSRMQSASSSNADAQAFARELLLGSRASLGVSAANAAAAVGADRSRDASRHSGTGSQATAGGALICGWGLVKRRGGAQRSSTPTAWISRLRLRWSMTRADAAVTPRFRAAFSTGNPCSFTSSISMR